MPAITYLLKMAVFCQSSPILRAQCTIVSHARDTSGPHDTALHCPSAEPSGLKP